MDTSTGKPIEPQGSTIFQLFALYVVVSQLINVAERLLPVFEREMAADDYESFIDTGYLLLIIVVACVALRCWRDTIVRSEFAPLYVMLGFALLLPYVRQLLADAVMEIVTLLMMGQPGPTRSGPIDRYLAVEPQRMISQIVLGVGAAGIWYQVLKRIFGANVQRVVRREMVPTRDIWLLLPFMLYAIALPAAIGLGVLIRNATSVWLPSEYSRYSYDLNYALAIFVISICLIALRGVMRCWQLSSVYLVLSFVLLMESFHNLIDREILNVVRGVTNDQMPWEESLPIRRTINYVAGAAYQTAVNVIGAAAAYGVLRLVFRCDLAAVVRRIKTVPRQS